MSVELDRRAFSSIVRKAFDTVATVEDFARLITSEVEAAHAFARICAGKDEHSTWIACLFNPHMFAVAGIKGDSFSDAIKRPGFAAGAARLLSTDKGISARQAIRFLCHSGVNGSLAIGDFPAALARRLYLAYNARRILDPCAGWGGRMIAAASIGAFYHGFDPSSRTCEGLQRLGDWLKQFGTGFDFRVECQPFEEATLGRGRYDLAFTSPPYFDTERYATEPTQSYLRHPSFEEWVAGFYLPMARKAARSSRQFVLNIGARTYDLVSPLMGEFVLDEARIAFPRNATLGRDPERGERFYEVVRRAVATPEPRRSRRRVAVG